jgi:hypothetical protein
MASGLFNRWKPMDAWGYGGLIGLAVSLPLYDLLDVNLGQGRAVWWLMGCALALAAIFRMFPVVRDWRERQQARLDGVHGKRWLTIGERR